MNTKNHDKESYRKFGIYDENDTLKSAVTWGPVGIEAVLAQFYPPEISLFLADMDVIKAREEALSFSKLLNQKRVETFFARDIIADTLKPVNIDFDMVLSILIQKADDIKAQFNTKNHKNYKEVIEELLKLDVERYGSDRGLTLNWKLSLYPLLPLGNLIYARDQMNILLSKRIRSHMKKDIRRPEVELYELCYQRIFGAEHKSIIIPEGETFEGGDAYVHDKTIYIGVGPRTSLGAALFIYRSLKEEIKAHGLKFVIVYDEFADRRSFSDQMYFMHLDTFSNPVGKKQIAVCLSEAKRRKVIVIGDSVNDPTLVHTGKTFLEYLFEDGQEIVSISESEQQTFGCNFLAVDENSIIVPLRTNKKTIEGLRDIGKNVIFADLSESTKGFGAAHCMTGQLLRQTNP